MVYYICFTFKDVHRRQKLTTDFFQTFWVDYFGWGYLSFEKKEYGYRGFQGGHFLRGFDNKIIGFAHIW